MLQKRTITVKVIRTDKPWVCKFQVLEVFSRSFSSSKKYIEFIFISITFIFSRLGPINFDPSIILMILNVGKIGKG